MIFIDGSNLLLAMADKLSISVRADQPTDEQIALACRCVSAAIERRVTYGNIGQLQIIRRYWFGAIQGSPELLEAKKRALRQCGYEARLFHKVKGRGEKGVDLAVAREMLIHGFQKNYSVAILVAGDEDYLGLVDDIKRQGLLVGGTFFDSPALSSRLRVALDHFQPIPDPKSIEKALAGQLQEHDSSRS